MLQRLVLLNSRVYGRAELKFDDCDSIQLVGPNNIGKSTLIYALNFLFVIDGNKMSFSGNRPGDKETIHHYFPTPNSSYIIFEIGKSKQYCILVKRNIEGELEYHYIGAAYNEDLFFLRDELGSSKLLKFEEVSKGITNQGIEFFQFKNKSEVFSHVYQRGTQSDAVVWLEDNVKTDGLSNSFSKVYRYLINSKLITNKTLKDSLIIADNRENETINFSQKNKKDITDLMRINNDIRAVKSIQGEFREFREIVNMYEAKNNILGQLVYAFNHNYETAYNNLDKRFGDKTKEISLLQNELNEVLEPKKQELNRNIGKKESEMALKEQELSRYEVQLEEISTFESEKFLNESLLNLEKERKETESRITRIENQKLSRQQVEQQLEKINRNLDRLEKQIGNYNAQFIHNIADKHEHKKLLNYILSADFAANSDIKIKKKVSKPGHELQIFDGTIELPKNLPLAELPSIEELKLEIAQYKAEKEEFEKLLPIALDFEKTKVELGVIHEKLEAIREKLHKLKNKPSLDKIAGELKKYISSLRADKDQLEKDLKLLNGEIAAKSGSLQVGQDERKQLEYRRNQLRERKIEVEMMGINPVEYDTNDSLDLVYNKLKNLVQERDQLKINKDKTFDHLRYKINSNIADVSEFVKYVEDEIACVEDKQKSIDGLLQSISTQFAYPAHNLFRRYQEFKEFVNNRFNQKLSEIKISDIESLEIKLIDNNKVLGELKKISAIEDFKGQLTLDFDQTENLKVLNNFLDSGKKINFNELFDIELFLKIKGQEKTVDLKDQVESDGTDRMIRLVIVMSIINRLAIDRTENKIVLFIDEVGTIDEHNRPELVRFCKEHSFIPIFAAPQPFDGFDKYYMLFRTQGKLNVNEKHHAIRRMELVR